MKIRGREIKVTHTGNNSDGGIIQMDSKGDFFVSDVLADSFKGVVDNFSALPNASTYITGGGSDGDLYSVLQDQGSVIAFNKKESGAYRFIQATSEWKFVSHVIQGVANFSNEGGGAAEVVIDRKSSNYTIIEDDKGKAIVVDTSAGDVIITMPTITIDNIGFNVYIKNIGDNDVIIQTPNLDTVKSLSSFSIGAGGQYGFSAETGNWEDFIKEVPAVQGDVTHFIGFYIEDGKLYADIAPVSADEVINLAKYNVLFEDGTPAWKFSSMSIVLEIANQAGITVDF